MNDLEREAKQLIARKIADGAIVELEWAVTELVKAQGEMIADNMEFWLASGREKAKRAVKAAIANYEASVIDEQEDRQLVLEGYDHMRVAYSIRGELVPVELISIEDLLARAAEFDKQAEGLKDHAEEIRRYVAERKGIALP